MAAKLTRLTHKIAIRLQLVAENCNICSSRSRRPIRKLLDTPLALLQRGQYWLLIQWAATHITECLSNFNGKYDRHLSNQFNSLYVLSQTTTLQRLSILQKYSNILWLMLIGFIWLKTGTIRGLLWRHRWVLSFHKTWEVPWIDDD
jgi:hypothetical protein